MGREIFSIEGIVQSIQGMLPNPVELSMDDNLIEFGLNSLQIMRLVNHWRKNGSAVTFAKLISNPTLNSWYKEVNVPRKKKLSIGTESKPLDIYQPFDMTDVQYAYWVGRRDGQILGGIGCHAYIEIDGEGIDVKRLNRAWKTLVNHHPMLHTRFTQDGKQQLIEDFQAEDIIVKDFSDYDSVTLEKALLDVRENLSHRKLDVEHGKNLGLTLSLMPNGKHRIHYDIDLLVSDVQSFQKVLDDLAYIYDGGELSKKSAEWNFAQYLKDNDEKDSTSYEECRQYWKAKVSNMPEYPKIPLKKKPKYVKRVVFNSRYKVVSSESWNAIKEFSKRYQVTPAMVLLTVYATVLERWSKNSTFNINLPIFNRNTENDGIEEVIADFSNLLILDVDLSKRKTFIEYVRDIQSNFHESMKYTSYSGVKVVRELSKKYPKDTNVAPIVFACNLGEPILSDKVRESFGEYNYMISQTPQVWLDFQMFDYEDGKLLLRWDAVDELFPNGLLNTMFEAYLRYLESLATSMDEWKEYPTLKVADDVAYDYSYNMVERKDFKPNSLIGDFLQYAEKNPNKKAIVNSATDETVTYYELRTQALKVASGLSSLGVMPKDKVAVTLPKGISQIQAVMGILMLNCCYVPVGVHQPLDRKTSIHKKANIKYVISDKKTISDIEFPEGTTVISIEDVLAFGEDLVTLEDVTIDCDTLAYIIFTSGSTGEPKGVEITHKSAYNTIYDVNDRYDVGESDSLLAISTLDFDLSVYDIFGMLSVGGTIVTIQDADKRNSESWLLAVNKYGVTVWNSVPAILDMFLVSAEDEEVKTPSLKRVFLSGDWIGLTIPYRLSEVAPNSKLTSLGGATEGSIWSNYFDVTLPLDDGWVSIPYGRPLSNQQYNVVDDMGRGCPEWVVGELLIGGDGVAVGYCNDPEQTSKHFFTDGNGKRWYRTGDLGRFREGGIIEFLGRKDFQVKVRGHRIELGEIEVALNSLNKLENHVVTTYKDTLGNNHLVAYLVVKNGIPFNETELKETIKDFLSSKLPSYMVPNVYIFLDKIPITDNGKVDTKALLCYNIDETMLIQKEYIEPSTDIEKSLADVWKATLLCKQVSLNDDYFELGGDSLLAVRLRNAIRETFKVKFSLEDIFKYSVLSKQAKAISSYIDENRSISSSESFKQITHDETNRFKPFPLTEIQKAYWIGRKGIYEFGNISTHYYFEVEDRHLDIPRFNDALMKVIENQDMMRAIILDDGQSQRVLEDIPKYEVKVYDVMGKSDGETQRLIENVRNEMAHRLFNANEFPLFDIRVIKVAEDNVRINLCFDNIIFDGYSIFLLFEELDYLYKNPNGKLPKNGISFRDYVIEYDNIKNTEIYEESKRYWLQRLDTLPPSPELPLRQDPNTNAKFSHYEKIISADRWNRLKDTILEYGGVTQSGLLIGAYVETLNSWSRKSQFTINLTHFNRLPLHRDINDIVGDFTSLTLLETDFSKGNSFLERCRNLQRQLWQDLDHPYYDGVTLQRDLAKKYDVKNAIMPVVFTSALGLNRGNHAKSIFDDRVYRSSETPQVWLDHQVSEEANGDLVLVWDFIEEVFPEGMVNQMFNAYCTLIDDVIDDKSIWIVNSKSIVDVQLPSEVIKANETQAELPEETLLSLYNRSVKEYPNNVAITDGETSLTYSQLDSIAKDIAVTLADDGIGKDSLVAVMMEKSVNQIVGVMGVIKSTAGYVPIDVKYPKRRVEGIVKEAEIEYILTDKNSYDKYSLGDVGCKLIIIDEIPEGIGAKYDTTLNSALDSLAYVIYTSGSTGKPKGVAINNRGVVNTILDVNRRFNVTSHDKTIGLSNLNFDLSVYDIFGMLSCGGGIVIVKEEDTKDPDRWLALMQSQNVTIWNTVPAFMQMLLECSKSIDRESSSLRLVLLSGDWIPLRLPDSIKATFKGVKVISLGGATEASIWSNFYEVGEVNPRWNSIPYGKPLSNQRFYILNSLMQKCPVGVAGTLYIAGSGLAVGYLNNPDVTAERFIEYGGETIYNTGDIGKYLPDGNVEFLGREDFQVKIRGFRIELGEVEEVVKSSGSVKQSCAVVSDSKQIFNFIVPNTQEAPDRLPIDGVDSKGIIDAFFNERSLSADSLKDFYTNLEKVSIGVVVDIFTTMGIFDETSPTTIQEVLDKYGIVQRYYRLVESWIKVLSKSGLVTYDGGTCTFKNPQFERTTIGDFKETFEELKALYDGSLPTMISVLTGDIEPLELFTSKGAVLTPLVMSKFNITSECQYRIVLETIKSLLKVKGTLNVAELGTRSGSFTEYISKKLDFDRVNYTYLDSSTHFINQKAENVSCDSIRYSKFDMEVSPYEQGVDAHTYDVIIADNTLHRASDVYKTLGNVKSLLKGDGILIVVEQSQNNCFVINTAGLLEDGFDHFDDLRKDKYLPLLNISEWEDVFSKVGLDTLKVYGNASEKELSMNTGLYILKDSSNFMNVDLNNIMAIAKEKLPDYMLPTKHIIIDSIPITVNGKVDRKSLTEVSNNYVSPVKVKDIVKPSTETEKMLYSVWSKSLHNDNISIMDNFFDVGGDSLTAIQCMNSLKDDYNVSISLQDIFQIQTIYELAIKVDQSVLENDDEGLEFGEL